MEGGGEVVLLYLLFLFFPFPVVSNLLTKGGRAYPCPSPCCHDLYDAVMHHSLCSTYCTSLYTLSPTADSCLFPSVHGLQDSIHDLDPSAHRALAPEAEPFGHQDFYSGIHQESESETVTWIYKDPRFPPSLLPGKGETVVSLSADTHKTLNESATVYVNVHNCAHFVEKKGSGGMICPGNVTVSGTGWGNRSKIWIWI